MQFKSDKGETAQVLVSFHSKWIDIFTDAPPSVVFRHRTPIHAPSRMYIYAGAPSCSVIGTCDVTSVERLSPKKAMALAAEGCISKSELKDYIAKHDDLGVYHIKKIKLTSNPLSLDLLRSKGRFFPPQSFLFVSDDGAKELDTLLK